MVKLLLFYNELLIYYTIFRNGLDSNQMLIFHLINYLIITFPTYCQSWVKNMIQTTFLDFAQSRISGLKVESLFEQFENKKNQKRQAIMNLKEEPIFSRLWIGMLNMSLKAV